MAERWLDVFGRDAKPRTLGRHVFSCHFFPSLSSEAASEAYRQQLAPEYVVLGSDPWHFAFATNVRPAPIPGSPCDYFVFPSNLAWTMLFTHHDFGYGELGPPYFARHPHYVHLNEENRTALDKLRQAEAETSRAQTPVCDAQPEQLVSVTGVKLSPLPGRCPNCEKLIPMDTQICRNCRVPFGPGSNWKVRPL